MLNINEGSIIIDGINLSTVPHQHVRESLVSVPQEALILEGSVRLNVNPLGSATDEEIVAVLEKVKLWDIIERRGGLDALIDDKFFSQGQSQLLLCARAMMRKSKILVLDEATSR